jgi:hypothetical protein
MKRLISLLALCLFHTACVISIPQTGMAPYRMPEGIREIHRQCDLINKTGDIFNLLGEIRRDTREIILILDEGKAAKPETLIEVLADNIRRKSELVTELSKNEWTTPDVRHEINWLMSKDDFRNTFENFSFSSFKVEKIFFKGEERPDLKKQIRFSLEGNKLYVKYLNAATLLEYCQLNETLMIVVEVKYLNSRYLNTKFVNLYVHLEN